MWRRGSLVSEIPSYVNQDAFTLEQIAALRDPVNEVAASMGNPFAQQSVRRANALATYHAGDARRSHRRSSLHDCSRRLRADVRLQLYDELRFANNDATTIDIVT